MKTDDKTINNDHNEQTEDRAAKNDTFQEHEDALEQAQAAAIDPEEESYKERYFKLSADFQNFKKRTAKERADWMHMAQVGILEELIPLFDDLDRAIELSEKNVTPETQAWVDGFKLAKKNWLKTFADLNIKEIDTTGEFDPNLHEALMQVEDADKEAGQIVQTFSKGYTFKDKVIKHAKVSVAK